MRSENYPNESAAIRATFTPTLAGHRLRVCLLDQQTALMTHLMQPTLSTTFKPIPPPKPQHLSTAYTGTVESEAFRQYIRSQATRSKEPTLRAGSQQDGSQGTTYDGDYDEDDHLEEDWRTARAILAQPLAEKPQKTPLRSIWTPNVEEIVPLSQCQGELRESSSISTLKAREIRYTERQPETIRAGNQKRGVSPSATACEAMGLAHPVHTSQGIQGGIEPQTPTSVNEAAMNAKSQSQMTPPDAAAGCVDAALSSVVTDRFSLASTSGASPHSQERSREPSILSARASRTFSKWDMQDMFGPNLDSGQNMTAAALAEKGPIASSEQTLDLNSNADTRAQQFSDLPRNDCDAGGTFVSPAIAIGRPARALYPIKGEAAFNELEIAAGQTFLVLSDQLAGGWVLAEVNDPTQESGARRGLVPEGWYALERQMLPPSASPQNEVHTSPQDEGYLAPVMVQASNISIEAIPPSCTVAAQDSQIQSSPSRSGFLPSLSAFLSPRHRCSGLQNAQCGDENVKPPCGESRAALALTHLALPLNKASPFSSLSRCASENSSASCRRGERGSVMATSAEAAVVQPDDIDVQSTDPAAPTPKGQEPRVPPFSRSLAPWSNFVSSGAEDYLLSPDDETGTSGSDKPALLLTEGKDVQQSCMSTRMSPLSPSFEIEISPHGDLRWQTPASRCWINIDFPHWVPPRPGKGWLRKGAKKGFMAFAVTSYVLKSAQCGLRPSSEDELVDAHSAAHTPVESDNLTADQDSTLIAYLTMTVSRRYRQFVILAEHLNTTYPLIALPPMPAKSLSRQFEAPFLEERRVALTYFLEQVVRHPVLSRDEMVTAFLTHSITPCQGEGTPHPVEATRQDGEDWDDWLADRANRTLLNHLSNGRSVVLFSRAFHPEFAIDPEEVDTEAKAAEAWLRTVEGRMKESSDKDAECLLDALKTARQGALRSSENLRSIGRSLLKLTSEPHIPETRGLSVHEIRKGPPKVTNDEGAWCWRSHCHPCRHLASNLHHAADAFQDIAAMHLSLAQERSFDAHQRAWNCSLPLTVNTGLFGVIQETLKRYQLAREADAAAAAPCELLGDYGGHNVSVKDDKGREAKLPVEAAELLASKAETVLSVGMAELDRVHSEKVEDYALLGRELLDSHIELYEGVLERLKEAKRHFGDDALGVDPAYSVQVRDQTPDTDHKQDGRVVTSPYAEELYSSHRVAPKAPLRCPSTNLLPPNVFERGVLRPLGLAGDVALNLARMASGSHPEATASG